MLVVVFISSVLLNLSVWIFFCSEKIFGRNHVVLLLARNRIYSLITRAAIKYGLGSQQINVHVHTVQYSVHVPRYLLCGLRVIIIQKKFKSIKSSTQAS